MIDKEELKCIVNKIDIKKIKCFDEKYFCREEINSISELKNEETIIMKFLQSYFGKVKFLYNLDEKQGALFIKWYEESGKYNLIPLLENVQYEKIRVISLVKTVTRYELLFEVSIHERNIDSMLNLLIDSIKTIYNKFVEWDCLNLNDRPRNIVDELIENKEIYEEVLQGIVSNIRYNVNNNLLNKINDSYGDLSLMSHKLKLSKNKELQKVYYLGMLYTIIGIHNIVENEQPKNKNIPETLERHNNLDKLIETIYNESVIDTNTLADKSNLNINEVNKILAETRYLDIFDSKYYGTHGEMKYFYLTEEGRKYYREIGKIRKSNLLSV